MPSRTSRLLKRPTVNKLWRRVRQMITSAIWQMMIEAKKPVIAVRYSGSVDASSSPQLPAAVCTE